ncbi:hypothetical protein HHI36_003761 [Cryptolaemus montrouzieri]|uniref:Uncharacterized protein n=1 Tax=Cryptolaemus montrouzieri TaxID=559131 RepID=A0ABD2PEX3_9CUCU
MKWFNIMDRFLKNIEAKRPSKTNYEIHDDEDENCLDNDYPATPLNNNNSENCQNKHKETAKATATTSSASTKKVAVE